MPFTLCCYIHLAAAAEAAKGRIPAQHAIQSDASLPHMPFFFRKARSANLCWGDDHLIGPMISGSENGNEQEEFQVKKLIAAAAAAALVISPTVAAAQSAAPTEVAPATEEAEGEGLRGGFILPLVAIVAVIIVIILLTKDDDDEEPITP
jgi:hypothetical protein